jgi:hypothetical protein
MYMENLGLDKKTLLSCSVMSKIRCRIRIVPKGRYIDNAGIYPCDIADTIRYPSPERATYYTVPLELRFGDILFITGINPCFEICRPFGTIRYRQFDVDMTVGLIN